MKFDHGSSLEPFAAARTVFNSMEWRPLAVKDRSQSVILCYPAHTKGLFIFTRADMFEAERLASESSIDSVEKYRNLFFHFLSKPVFFFGIY